MAKSILVCLCVAVWALTGCVHAVHLEEDTPPGRVPPVKAAPVSSAPDVAEAPSA